MPAQREWALLERKDQALLKGLDQANFLEIFRKTETPRAPIHRRPAIPHEAERHYRYGLQGDAPPWRPVSVFDDGRRVYVVFPPGIAQGEMPPLFVIGADGRGQIVNTRVLGNVLIVDRLFGAAELRLGERQQQVVRIVRTDGDQRPPRAPQPEVER